MTLANNGVFALCSDVNGSDHPKLYNIPGGVFYVPPDTTSWAYVDYNNGSPVIQFSNSWNFFTYTQSFPFYLIVADAYGGHTVFDAEGTAKACTLRVPRVPSAKTP